MRRLSTHLSPRPGAREAPPQEEAFLSTCLKSACYPPSSYP